MRQPPKRSDRVLVGFAKRFWHVTAKRMIYAKNGRVFPIYRKVSR